MGVAAVVAVVVVVVGADEEGENFPDAERRMELNEGKRDGWIVELLELPVRGRSLWEAEDGSTC
jgi:hypothetical protein